jgi:hypothetical protein
MENVYGLKARTHASAQELCKEETMSYCERNQPASVKQESDLRVPEHVEIGNCWMEPLKAGIFGFERKGQNLKIELGILTVVAVCSLISIVALLRLDAVVHQDLYSYGLQFSLEWATPYWIAIGTALGMLWFTVIAAVLFQIYVLTHKSRGKGTNEQWKTYALADGSTIKVKTVVKKVKRLNEYGHDGKPVYSVEADNVVEVVEAPKSLMAS